MVTAEEEKIWILLEKRKRSDWKLYYVASNKEKKNTIKSYVTANRKKIWILLAKKKERL